MNADECLKENAREERLIEVIQLLAEPGAKRRKDKLSVQDEISFRPREKTQWSYEGISPILLVNHVQRVSLYIKEKKLLLGISR
jgi:hypothetical protein